jgi:hydroxyacyl-ACP dehydratase HTD2-like protein with hotdog domain
LYFLDPNADSTISEDSSDADWTSGRTFWNPLLPLKFGLDARCFVRKTKEDGTTTVEKEMGGREGWSVRERREVDGRDAKEERGERIEGSPAFSRTFTPNPLLAWRFSALSYNPDPRYWDRSRGTSLLLNPDLQFLLLLDLVRQFRPDLAPSSFSYTRGQNIEIDSQPVELVALSSAENNATLFRLEVRKGGATGVSGDLVCVVRESARAVASGGKPVSGLNRMIRWE